MTIDGANLGSAVLAGDAAFTDLSGDLPLTVTFAEFDGAVGALAVEMAQNLPSGSTVGILGENSLRWLIVFYAAMRAGMIAVPINYRQPAEIIDYIVGDAGLARTYADDGYRHLLPARTLDVRSIMSIEVRASGPHTVAEVDPEQSAMFLYTSGSTGRPKGVVLSHRSHLWVVRQGTETAPQDAALLISAPLYHMGALSPVQRALGAGQSVVLLPTFQPRTVAEVIDRYRITDLNAVPPMMAMLLRETEALAEHDISSVRTVILNSAPASKELLEDVAQTFGDPALVFTYGTTESSPIAFTSDGRPIPVGSVGVPHPAVEVRLVDPETGAESREQGVLQIRSPGLMTGYHRRPDIPSPITEDGYYHTKDLFRCDEDGFYYFLGREDDMFVSGGENLYPRAIELALEAHDAVAQAAVVPVPDAVKGYKPVAFVTLVRGAEFAEDALKSFSLTKLEPAAHPRRIWRLPALPLASTNKLDKESLTRLAVERVSS